MSYKAFYPATMTRPSTGKTFDRTVSNIVSKAGCTWYDATRVAESMFFAERTRRDMTTKIERAHWAREEAILNGTTKETRCNS